MYLVYLKARIRNTRQASSAWHVKVLHLRYITLGVCHAVSRLPQLPAFVTACSPALYPLCLGTALPVLQDWAQNKEPLPVEFSGWLGNSSEVAQVGHPSFSCWHTSPMVSLPHASALPVSGPNTAGRAEPMLGSARERVFFPAQVNELPPSTVHKEKLEAKESDPKRPLTAPREAKRTRRKHPSASVHSKYYGYEELLTAKPDPAFVEPKGMSGPGAPLSPERARPGSVLPSIWMSVRGFLGHGSVATLH